MEQQKVVVFLRERKQGAGQIGEGSAPSYYIEGLLYNVPTDKFVGEFYQDIFLNILKWLHETKNRSEFVCANEQLPAARQQPHMLGVRGGRTFHQRLDQALE